ncbi:hypothetical protein EJ110_NYTH42548 [Nymphaea thermarum]|nr:hypothetical protein EJ110_NYTH42548 [Nymphaea thermarum]
MTDAIASIGPGFKMPSYHQLGKILEATVKEVMEHCDQLKLSWKKIGTMFLKSLHLSNVPKIAKILINVFDNVVQEVGHAKIIQFIIENAANYRAAEDIPCVTHCANLILQDLSQMYNMKSVVDQCQEITKFIYNHAYVLSLMRKFTKGIELIRLAQTRFTTNVLTVQSIVKQRTPLRQMFSSEEWVAYPHAYKRKSSLVVDIIFNNEFWDNLKEKKKLYMPIWKIIDKREVMHGLLNCVEVLVTNSRAQDVVRNETSYLTEKKSKKPLFSQRKSATTHMLNR